MKIPLTPPPLKSLITDKTPEEIFRLMNLSEGPEPRGEYLHWDQLRHKPLPKEIDSHEDWWFTVKQARIANYQKTSLRDPKGNAFVYSMTEGLLRRLHEIDRNASGTIRADAPIATDANRDRFIISSLFEEAITSSQLEGASTTTRVAKDMLRSGRKPRDHSEKMIVNNYNAMNFIRENREEDLSVEFLLELHTIITMDTLDDPSQSGRWRREDEDVTVQDNSDGTLLYRPPDARLIDERIENLIEFANKEQHDNFIHPAACAVILHFMLAYEHPFADGNGRTARALFYWYMARAQYWLVEYISISRVIKRAPVKYAKSYIYVENDHNDLSYFLNYQFDVIIESIDSLFEYLTRKTQEYKKTQSILRGELSRELNHRQIALLSHALKNPGFTYTIKSHARSHSTSYQTARTDLLGLSELGLLNQFKQGKAFVFESPPDLDHMVENFRKD